MTAEILENSIKKLLIVFVMNIKLFAINTFRIIANKHKPLFVNYRLINHPLILMIKFFLRKRFASHIYLNTSTCSAIMRSTAGNIIVRVRSAFDFSDSLWKIRPALDIFPVPRNYTKYNFKKTDMMVHAFSLVRNVWARALGDSPLRAHFCLTHDFLIFKQYELLTRDQK